MMVSEDPRVTVRLPPKLLERLKEEVDSRGLRWDQRGDILIIALSDYFRRQDPAVRKEEIIQAFQEDPQALRGLVQQSMSDILGRKPSP
ncbi:MAG: hypothetical protein M0Q92_10165 [Methanoregula sp.]|jgi:hypothetical protein|nr:hypothetical protein [Methanoregula sp.]